MKSITALILILVLAGVFSCRKYEDGPDISWGSMDDRLKGIWDVELFYINGQDSTGAVKNQTCYFPFVFYGLTTEVNNFAVAISSYPADSACACIGRYTLIDDNKTLWLIFKAKGTGLLSVGPLYDNGGNIYIGKSSKWKINKLTNKELWLETIWNSQYCILHLNKIYI